MELLHHVYMSAFGGMCSECRKFYYRLAAMIAEKRKQNYSLAASLLGRKFCLALINSVCILFVCIRGSISICVFLILRLL